nr:MopE-related protein [Myxococcota bacterium]
MRRLAIVCLTALSLSACMQTDPAPPMGMLMDEPGEVGLASADLTAAQRRVRAGQIRDAAFGAGMEQGWMLAGIADAETRMSHCWSELTWACMGPNSADCGGGPVVAGAGDGPCSIRQGGLGMFQFDAGTFDDTLRREGTRILSIAGNTQAAVDFVASMVIRSAYVPGVETRAQAIAWMNGVRVGNGRWDAWIRTVTHYYNGCAPSYSCFSSRYAHYRDNTSGVYNEMGAAFWVTTRDWGAQYVMQTFPLARDPFPLEAGSTFTGYLEMRNTGAQAWRPGEVFLGTTEPRDVASPLAGPDWISPNRAATIDRVVAPGESGRFEFTVRAPDAAGEHSQFFNLVREGVSWFSESGGPADGVIQIRVQSTAPPPCPDGIGDAWSCEGTERVRCERGMVFREPCELGCTAGVCDGPAVDEDGDGYGADDCAPGDAAIHPGALEICEDGVDQDCDGVDAIDCAPADGDGGGTPARRDGGMGM